jgi:SAM-dependent methyltransferase
MTLIPIKIPDDIKHLHYSESAERIIDVANERIELFLLEDDSVIENFVTCDFHLFDQAMTWIEENHLLTGNRFCELGSGFGVAAILAAKRGMDSVGIEIESRLVEQAGQLAEELKTRVRFRCGSFVPRDLAGIDRWSTELRHVETEEGDVYSDLGLEIDDFDLFFAFPWPGEHEFFEAIIDDRAASGALLMTYCGRDGMHLLRKR